MDSPTEADTFERHRIRAESGDMEAQYNLAACYEKGVGTPSSQKDAIKWYRVSAENGWAEAQAILGWLYSKGGEEIAQSDAEAVKWYLKAAEQGNREVLRNLMWHYANGRGVPQSHEEAAKWCLLDAEQGNHDAQYTMGKLYEAGRGVPRSDLEAVRWYRHAAEQGHAAALRRMGSFYERGQGVIQSSAEAIKWYQRAVEKKNIEAAYDIGVLYERGVGVEKNPIEAVKWFQIGAGMGNVHAKYDLGNMYIHGSGVTKDTDRALYLFTEAAAQKFYPAIHALGVMHYLGDGVERNYYKAVEFFRVAAEEGKMPRAQADLGGMYACGLGVVQDDTIAIRLSYQAASQGDAVGQRNLAIFYHQGRGGPQIYAEAIIWYKKAVEQLDMKAYCYLGFMYLQGQGIEKNLTEGMRLTIIAAESGNAEAQYNLAVSYKKGAGVERSDEKAIYWAHKAAASNHFNAQTMLGNAYHAGQGIEKNDAEASKWYQKAAEQGDADSQNILGYNYEVGEGVEKDYVRSFMWYSLAARQNIDHASKKLDLLAKRMTSGQISEANRLLQTWEKQEFSPDCEIVMLSRGQSQDQEGATFDKRVLPPRLTINPYTNPKIRQKNANKDPWPTEKKKKLAAQKKAENKAWLDESLRKLEKTQIPIEKLKELARASKERDSTRHKFDMSYVSKLPHTWLFVDAKAELASYGISLENNSKGYRINFSTGNTPNTACMTDNLLDALIIGFEMALGAPYSLPNTALEKKEARLDVIRLRLKSLKQIKKDIGSKHTTIIQQSKEEQKQYTEKDRIETPMRKKIDPPNLNRTWLFSDVQDELWSHGIGMKNKVEGYRINYFKGGTTHTEYVTNDLLDALITGLEMASTPPKPLPTVLPKKRVSYKTALLQRIAELKKAKKEKEKKEQEKEESDLN